MRIPKLLSIAAAGALLLGPAARPGTAQLISPGELSEAHSDLEGLRGCTSCHQLRSKGIDAGLCLDCHEPLRSRIDAGRGYHPAADATSACARCHKEHFGRDFALVRWEPSEFDHATIGWEPQGAHAALECRACHTSSLVRASDVRSFKGRFGALSRTWLGLEPACLACHGDQSPHGEQFAGQACEDCHSEDAWEEVPGFDHDRTRYRLTGLHRRVECAGCHPPREAPDRPTGAVGATTVASDRTSRSGALRFTGLSFGACTACHRDEHDGRMGPGCEECHTTAGWHSVGEQTLRDRFDHAAGFPLEGAHAEAACDACHGRPPRVTESVRIAYAPATAGRSYPIPEADACMSCHVDEHRGEFAAAGAGSAAASAEACDRCHTQDGWIPALFDLHRHNVETRHRLQGAHVAIPCLVCHPASTAPPAPSPTDPRFRIGLREACADCHAADDPHGGQFAGRACDECHDDRSFHIGRFDHDRTGYPLDGRHRDLACAECHPAGPAPDGGEMIRYRPLPSDCTDCHGGGT